MARKYRDSLLIIEDNDLIAGFYTTIFKNLGIEVYRVNGEECIEELSEEDLECFNIIFLSDKARLDGLHLIVEKKLTEFRLPCIDWIVMADIKTSTIHFNRKDQIHLFDTAEYNLHGIVSQVEEIIAK